MPTCTISEKGQITLPATMRKQLGIKPQDRVLVEIANGEITIRPAPDLFELQGFLGKRKSERQERRAVVEGFAQRARTRK